eukprot:Skav228189  [mRNA]  locus=scaffold3933:490161:491421:+ [translate_table: standard]
MVQPLADDDFLGLLLEPLPTPKRQRHVTPAASAWWRCCRRRNGEASVSKDEAALHDEVLVKEILSFCSMGSLQLLGMTNKTWLNRTNQTLASLESVTVDMNDWPFCMKELRDQMRHQTGWISFDFSSDSHLGPVSVKDSRVTDADLRLALGKFRSTQLTQLVLSSSLITPAGVCWVLDTFAHGLRELAISSCKSGNLASGQVQASLEKCVNLCSLHLEEALLNPPRAARLQSLILGSNVMAWQQMWPINHFQHLQVLSFVPNTRFCIAPRNLFLFHLDPASDEVVYQWFLSIFRQCIHLREINIYNAHFVNADVFIDDVYAEQLMEEEDYLFDDFDSD